ncbi:flagellar basal body P-ring protein FlgI [Endozoicomonadaceae bacterium StTr2]
MMPFKKIRAFGTWLTIVLVAMSSTVSVAATDRTRKLLDLVDIQGVRSNQLIGYGLVVGLDGSGDKTRQTQFTSQSLKNMLRQLGVQLPSSVDPKLKNVAAVSVTATLPPFTRPGQSIDVTVSSIGDAVSLKGGVLLQTQLKGADGNVYALAQGSLLVSGYSVDGKTGSSVTSNVPTVGRIPDGGIVERSVPGSFQYGQNIVLSLKSPNFTTARNIVESVNNLYGAKTAWAVDGAVVEISAPADSSQRVVWMAALENLDVNVGRIPARVIINSRSGTVVMNEHVRVKPAAVSHGNLVVTIRESLTASQPPSNLGKGTQAGQTVVLPQTSIQVEEQKQRIVRMPGSSSLQDVINAVNSVGATPTDLMAVLQALKRAGALEAELVVI